MFNPYPPNGVGRRVEIGRISLIFWMWLFFKRYCVELKCGCATTGI